jgi:hypothetical protein
MIPFKPVRVTDKDAITAITFPSQNPNCDFSFANMCSWSFFYDSEFAIVDHLLLIRFFIGTNGNRRRAYMHPAGTGDLRNAIRLLEEDAQATGQPLRMLGITPNMKQELESALPGQFTYHLETDFFDYIYLRTDLETLTGKRYQSKRNHINKFKNTHTYSYHPLTPETVDECIQTEQLWLNENANPENQAALTLEQRSINFALTHHAPLGITGGLVRVDGHIAAFTYGFPINHNTFGVHAEKALAAYEGLYNLINHEFAAHIPPQYLYVNREEDLGIPGLRRAKQSYHPAILLQKYTAIKKS